MQTTPGDDDDDLPAFDEPMTFQDWIEVIGDEIDEAAETLNDNDLDSLCAFLRKKIDDLMPF